MKNELRPILNNTKWRELIAEMRALQQQGLIVQHLAKDVRGPWPSPQGWDGEWYYHLQPFDQLEWIDIRCEEKSIGPYRTPVKLTSEEFALVRSEIIKRLKAHSVPFSIEGQYVRVWGYLRAGTSPDWR